MKYFIKEFLGLKIMTAVKTVTIYHLSEILRDPLWGPQYRTFWDSLMNYFIVEFLCLKIVTAVKTVIIYHLSEILRDPLWGPQDRLTLRGSCVPKWSKSLPVMNIITCSTWSHP